MTHTEHQSNSASANEPRCFHLTSTADAITLHCYAWQPQGAPRGVVVIAHGLGEHAQRYNRIAQALNDEKLAVFAIDHRGHGNTATADTLGNFLAPGWNGLVSDLAQLVAAARQQHPSLPLFLFGHSMGSFASQQYILEHSNHIDGLILSGSAAMDQLIAAMLAAAGEATEEGSSFSPLNAPFEPARTDFDWLSRDEAEVDAYLADPLCGFDLDAASNLSMVSAAAALADADAIARIRKNLPILLLAGDADPINNGLVFLTELEKRYRKAGIMGIETQYYAGGRHEMLNETNRAEVTRHLIAWLQARL